MPARVAKAEDANLDLVRVQVPLQGRTPAQAGSFSFRALLRRWGLSVAGWRVHYGLVDAKSPAEAELASLRRRAYGPDADIGADPRAQARLADLERQLATREYGASAVARTAPPIGRATEVDDPPTVETAHGGSAAPDAGDEAETGIAATPAESAPSASAPGRMRRALPWVIAAGAVVVATALGAMYFDAVTEPLVEAQLVALDEPLPGSVPPALSQEDLGWTTDPVFVSHGRYGPLEVWSTTAPHNWQCLAVVFRESVLRFNCTVSSLDTVTDVAVQEGLWPPDFPGSSIPHWSSIRFVLRDDVVDVYIGRNPDPDASRAATEGPYGADPFGGPLPHGGAELADTNWVLGGAWWGNRDLNGIAITLDFAADTAGGNGGVNTYTAGYTSAPDGALTFSDIASTTTMTGDVLGRWRPKTPTSPPSRL